MRKFIYLLLLPICLIGCNKNNQANIDQSIIEQYITTNHLNATAEPNGLYYVPLMQGTGPNPTINSQVTVTYKGYLTNGTVFDQSTSPVSFPLGNVIPGWQEGIPLMQKGGKATLLIPSALGYGSQANGSIPANSVLIFDVQLISFQ
jgi:FKBP-type peptidyl-prolyl cis-trans isomerase FkpA